MSWQIRGQTGAQPRLFIIQIETNLSHVCLLLRKSNTFSKIKTRKHDATPPQPRVAHEGHIDPKPPDQDSTCRTLTSLCQSPCSGWPWRRALRETSSQQSPQHPWLPYLPWHACYCSSHPFLAGNSSAWKILLLPHLLPMPVQRTTGCPCYPPRSVAGTSGLDTPAWFSLNPP